MTVTHRKHQRHMRLFPATGPLEFIALDILGPIPKTKDGNQYEILITDRYKKLPRAIPVTKTAVPHVAAVVLDHLIIPYGIQAYLLMEKGHS